MSSGQTNPLLSGASLYYQPQVTADGLRLAGVECLLRSVDADGCVNGPQAILAAVTTDEEADAVDWWVIRQACLDGRRWPGLSVGINVSARQFQSAYFAGKLLDLLAETGMPAAQVELELLESGIIEHFDRAVSTMDTLRTAGIRIALDDFGTGYSSLSYLQRLPIDKIKLDKSLVDGCGEMKVAAIIQAVAAMSRALGLKVVAEGVETEAQQRFLKVAGCHLLQGYLFSPAIAAEEIDARLSGAGQFRTQPV